MRGVAEGGGAGADGPDEAKQPNSCHAAAGLHEAGLCSAVLGGKRRER